MSLYVFSCAVSSDQEAWDGGCSVPSSSTSLLWTHHKVHIEMWYSLETGYIVQYMTGIEIVAHEQPLSILPCTYHSTPDGGGHPQGALANGLKQRRQRMRPGLRLVRYRCVQSTEHDSGEFINRHVQVPFPYNTVISLLWMKRIDPGILTSLLNHLFPP